MLDYVGLIPLFPAIGFAINLFFGRRMAKGVVGFIACAAIGLSFLVSLLIFNALLQLPPAQRSVEKILYPGSSPANSRPTSPFWLTLFPWS